MPVKYYYITFFLFISCSDVNENNTSNNLFNDKENLNSLIDAYVFLSENHDLLHIMMGEYDGSPIESYEIYINKIESFNKNYYLKPILTGLDNIIIKNDKLKNAAKFDALVDYYQMGLQIMIEGILKGYGYENILQNSEEYNKIKNLNF